MLFSNLKPTKKTSVGLHSLYSNDWKMLSKFEKNKETSDQNDIKPVTSGLQALCSHQLNFQLLVVEIFSPTTFWDKCMNEIVV